MIQHVTLEAREQDAPAEARFWALLGFTLVEAPVALAGRSLWVERSGTQVHVMYAERPEIPASAHVAVVASDYDEAIARLCAAGHAVEPRTAHWGAARSYTRSPAGHRVEVMAAAPPAARG